MCIVITPVVSPHVLPGTEQPEAQPNTATASQIDERKLIGPVLGPIPPPHSPRPINGSTSRSQSPYFLQRSVIRDLTLPPVPNFDIPPSPPGSPPAKTLAKFAQFLELKKQGVHFNEKLAKSSALKNPSLFQKLTKFAGIDEQEQYTAALPKEVYDPSAFPSWAYKEELAKSQQEVQKKKEEDRMRVQREGLDFVPASTTAETSRAVVSGGETARGYNKSAAERVMAGLDRGKTKSPYTVDGNKRRPIERRGGRS